MYSCSEKLKLFIVLMNGGAANSGHYALNSVQLRGGAAAGALDGVDSSLRIGQAGKSDVGALGGKINRGRLHAGDRVQRALDAPDTNE